MKKNWISIVSLVLNIVLLVFVIGLAAKLERTEENLRGWIGHVEDEVQESRDSVVSRVESLLEDAEKQVAEFSMEPVGMDADNRALEVSLQLNLRHWSADTTVTVVGTVGTNVLHEVLSADAAGSYSGTLSIPVESGTEIRLTVVITTGGETVREELGDWGEISMLLPLQTGGGGWDGPVYQNGILSSQFHITIDGQDNQKPGAIENPEFRIYRNGELVQTFGAVIDPTAGSSSGFCYTVDTEDYRWGLECDEGDVIEIRFLCQDEFGLSYDWLFAAWTPEGEITENRAAAGVVSGLGDLKLIWPE
jgi:hypothetical protein